MAKRKKEDFMKSAMELGLGIGGGVAGNFATTWLEKQPFMGKAAPYSSALVALIGAAGFILIPPGKGQAMEAARNICFGISVIGGTESAETLLAKTGVMSGIGMGLTQQQMGIGFSGKLLADQANGNYVNGVPVR